MEQKLLHTKLTSNEEMEEYLSEQQDEMEVEEIRDEGMEIIDGEVIDGMGDTDTSSTIAIQKTIDERKNEVFWYSDTNIQKIKLAIDNRRLLKWLKRNGHSLLRDGKGKTSGWNNISIIDGVIDKEDEDTMREMVYKYFDKQDSYLWDDENAYGVYKKGKSGDMWCKMEVMNKMFNHSFKGTTFGYNIKVVFDDYNYNTLPMLTDSSDKVYIPFRNKVVHITKTSTKLMDYDKISHKGSVWKSAIIPHDISIKTDKEEGVFEKFCRLATSKRKGIKLTKGTNWTSQYETNEDVLKSLKTAYGYLISNYNNPSQPVAPIFMDGEAEIGLEEGRNGKSVVMGSINHWKEVAYQSGKSYQSTKSSGGRFQYSNVEIDTRFVYINDAPEWFDMEDLYDRLSDDFEVGSKYKNKFVIPRDKKPKMGITTNFPVRVKGGSARHRMHITPFGNYWLMCKDNNEESSDKKHLGKLMFEDDYTKADWNDFYNFGFECVRLYLNDGLHKCDTSGIKLKGLISKWEEGLDNGVVRWLVDVIEEEKYPDMSNYPGIPRTRLHTELCKHLTGNHSLKMAWGVDEKKFNKMVFDICKVLGYKYNEQKSHIGNTPHDRRILKKDKNTNKNIEYICINK